MDIAISINKVPIRLTKERWQHISLGHPEMAAFFDEILEAVEFPEFVYIGNNEELLAIKSLNNNKSRYIVVIYKEIFKNDGFIITSFITNKKPYIVKKKLIWKQ